MLAKRIIPCLDVKDGRVVKGVNFVGLRDAGDPVELAKFYSQEGADEIVFLDITATSDNRDTIADVVRRTCREVFVPVTVGGGIRTVDDFREILRAGADKISINSSAVKNPDLVNAAAEKYGSQCVVVAIDARANEQMPSGFEVYVAGGRTPTGKDAVAWANANGIVTGYGNGKFGPNDVVTREQFAAILYRYAQYKKYDVSVGEDTNILSYADAQSVSAYAIPAMQWAGGAGIVNGSNGKLNPQNNATRAEVAAMLMRYCEKVAK